MKYLYNIKLLVGALLLLTVLFSCEDVLDESPISQTLEGQNYTSNNNARLGVAGIYDAMQESFKLQHYLWGEFRSDNFIPSKKAIPEYRQLAGNTLSPSMVNTLRWNELYTMIGRANLAIEKIPTIPAFDQDLLGQAYALRAYAYFNIVRVWGQGPVFLEAIKSLDQEIKKKQTPGDQIITDIVIPDMKNALKFITATTGEFRFTTASVLAFSAHVYMHTGEHQLASDAIDDIVALNQFSLASDRKAWANQFLNDIDLGKFQIGSELIFSIKYNLVEDGQRAAGVYALFYAGVPSFVIAPGLHQKWNETFPTNEKDWLAKYPNPEDVPTYLDANGDVIYGDYRYYESFEEARAIYDINNTNGGERLAKYAKRNFSPALDDTNTPIYRLSGLLLLKAEALNQLGQREEALDIVNTIRIARELPQINKADYPDQESALDVILTERQFELLGEGHRWWDLVRNDKAEAIIEGDNKQTLFPVYERHLVDNNLLKQTTGY